MKLLLLRCPQCNQALAPGQDDVAIQCPNCRAAVGIYENGLRLLPAQYAAPQRPQPSAWLPFWVYRGQVHIRSRKTQGGRSAEKEALEFWGQPRYVFIPAWACELPYARDLIQELLEQQPRLSALAPPEGATFLPVAVAPEDGRKLLELVIVSIEARRNDWMESLSYDLRMDSEALWLLPAEPEGETWKLGIRN